MNLIDRVINARMQGWSFFPAIDDGMRVEFRNIHSIYPETFVTNGPIEMALWHIENYDLLNGEYV